MAAAVLAVAVAAADGKGCPEGWSELSGSSCLLLGARPGLVVFLHGMARPEQRWLDAQLSVASSVPWAQRVPLVAPRGRAGFCEWSDEVKRNWCWPSDVAHLEALPALEAALATTIAAVRRRLDVRGPAVLAGYSNGGFAVALMMAAGSLPVVGYAVLHGGLPTTVELAAGTRRPTLLVTAAQDSVHAPRMRELGDALASAGWPTTARTRAGGHWITPEDFKALFDFAAAVQVRP